MDFLMTMASIRHSQVGPGSQEEGRKTSLYQLAFLHTLPAKQDPPRAQRSLQNKEEKEFLPKQISEEQIQEYRVQGPEQLHSGEDAVLA